MLWKRKSAINKNKDNIEMDEVSRGPYLPFGISPTPGLAAAAKRRAATANDGAASSSASSPERGAEMSDDPERRLDVGIGDDEGYCNINDETSSSRSSY